MGEFCLFRCKEADLVKSNLVSILFVKVPFWAKSWILVNGTYEYNYEYDIETRNGKKFAKINSARSSCKYDVEKAIFNLHNLFNGNEMLGE